MGDAYKGGLNPYCVMIMLVAFLRHSNLCDCTDVGEVLLQFLYFYSEVFDFKKICIDVSD
jgi:DNA polymerase sigma